MKKLLVLFTAAALVFAVACTGSQTEGNTTEAASAKTDSVAVKSEVAEADTLVAKSDSTVVVAADSTKVQ